MANWSLPALTSSYTNFVDEVKNRDSDLAVGLDPALVTPSNVLTNTIRWSSAASKWQKYNGSTWADLSATFAIAITGNAGSVTNGVYLDATQTLTNKTLTSSAFNGSVGATTPSTGAFSNLSYTGTLTGGTGIMNFGSGQFVKDANGNVGIGVTPSAWGANFKAIESAGNAAAVFAAANINGVSIASNTYNNNTNWIYKTTGAAAYYSVNTGVHQWYNAPSGTAGAAISFTQAMTLDASGNLGLGTSSPDSKLVVSAAGDTTIKIAPSSAGTARLILKGAGGGAAAITSVENGFYFNTEDSAVYIFNTGSTERIRIDSSGNLIANASVTGYWKVPVGTTAQRPTGASGMIRYNSSVGKYEGYSASAWASIGGGATGGGADEVFVENGQTVTTNYTLSTNKNASSVGPITINAGITVTVPSGSTWAII